MMETNKIRRTAPPMLDWPQLDQVIRRDPARRGLASYVDDQRRPLLLDQVKPAARDLAEHGRHVLLVTGFSVTTDVGVTAETDGPPGTIYLAAMLRAAGIDALIATDAYAAPLLRAGLAAARLPSDLLTVFAQTSNNAAARAEVLAWRERRGDGSIPFSHLVAIERVGPSHTAESIASQYGLDDARRAQFERLVPPEERDVCHNMRGVSIDGATAPLHVLFEEPPPTDRRPRPRTIGIVDGGNEIGCGSIPWDVLQRATAQGAGATIACRIKTHHTILAGISNWGAYALGASVAMLCENRDTVKNWTADKQRSVIRAIVEVGCGVDGITKRREPTVDGLPLADYLAVFDEVRRIATL